MRELVVVVIAEADRDIDVGKISVIPQQLGNGPTQAFVRDLDNRERKRVMLKVASPEEQSKTAARRQPL